MPTITKLRRIYSDHTAYRTALGFKDNKAATWTATPTDLDDRRTVKKSTDILCTLIEDAIYNKLHDNALRQGWKMNKSPEDVLNYITIAT